MSGYFAADLFVLRTAALLYLEDVMQHTSSMTGYS